MQLSTPPDSVPLTEASEPSADIGLRFGSVCFAGDSDVFQGSASTNNADFQ